jgi:hypothetical protein
MQERRMDATGLKRRDFMLNAIGCVDSERRTAINPVVLSFMPMISLQAHPAPCDQMRGNYEACTAGCHCVRLWNGIKGQSAT